MFDVIERLKADWTDKYVVIDSPAPELARFARSTGQVKTVNMNGRCLVEFDQFNNIGWYDVDPSCLKIVPKPAEPKAKAPQASAKPAAAKPAAAKAPAAPAAGGAKKPSTADILAAARAKAGSPAAKPATAAKPAAGAKLSTADILARARGAKAAAPAAAPETAAAEPAPETEAEVPPPTKATVSKKAAGKQPATTAEKIAWCRAHDAKG